MARVLVTGGSGYFGSFLCGILAKNGDETHNFDLVDYDEPVYGVTVNLGDIRNYDDILKATKGIDIVHHNVAQVPIAKNKELFDSVNYDGAENLLKACLENGVKKIIYVSSSAVYGIPSKNPVDDSVEPNPMEDYGRSKYKAEKLCQEYIKKGLDITIIRPRTILGHGRLGIFQILFEWIRHGVNVYTLGSGDNLYQFVHAEDLADACIRASYKKGPSVYNIGAEKFGSMKETLEGLINAVNSKSKIRSLPFRPTIFLMDITSKLGLSPLGPYHSLMYGRDMYFDISRAKRELNWQPKWNNIDMFIDSYNWYVNNLDKVFNNKIKSYHKSPMRLGVLRLLRWVPYL